jgi:hypothetical protein
MDAPHGLFELDLKAVEPFTLGGTISFSAEDVTRDRKPASLQF